MIKLLSVILLIGLSTSLWAVKWDDPIYILNSEHGEDDIYASYTPDDQIFVVWSSAWTPYYNDISYAQVTEDGTLTIQPTRIFEDDGVFEQAPTVTVDTLGHTHIFWQRETDGSLDIWYAQLDTTDGSYIVNPKHLIRTQMPNDLYMYAVPDDDNNIHLLYCVSEWDGEDWWDSPQHAKLDSSGNLLFCDHAITDDSFYRMFPTWDKGLAVDSDGNVHVVYTYDNDPESGDQSVVYRKIDGNDGTPLTPMIDLGYPTRTSAGVLAHEPHDNRPAICIDSVDQVHIAYSHYEDYEYYLINCILDKDGNILLSPQITYHEWDLALVDKNYLIIETDRIFLFLNIDDGIGIFEFDSNGELVTAPVFHEGVIVGHDNMGPTGAVGPSGLIRIVGRSREDEWDYDVMYVRQIENPGIDDVLLNAESDDDGILLSWREEGDLIGSTWRLERDGERLVNLSGDALYRYLDRDAEPDVTHLYTLEATLPDGSVRSFGPVEAAWPGPDAGRFTLYAPYPCPAADQVTLSFYLPEGTKNVELSLYDLSGRLVESSVSVPTTPGRHEIAYDTSGLPSGVYVARLTTDTSSTTKRLIIAR
jgi:hypothetical protein